MRDNGSLQDGLGRYAAEKGPPPRKEAGLVAEPDGSTLGDLCYDAPMTVAELIEKLTLLPQDALVVADDRYVACDVEPRLGAVAPSEDWGDGAYDIDDNGPIVAVIL